MAAKITRTIKSTHITIKAADGSILKEFRESGNVDRKKVAMAYIKETGDTMFSIDMKQIEELREIEFEVFMANSKVVGEPTSPDQTETPVEA